MTTVSKTQEQRTECSCPDDQCQLGDHQTCRWKEYFKLVNEIEQSHKHGVMQVPQFEELLQVRLDELPYTKHLDDGQYNDGQAYGFECGARWAYEKLSSGTAVGNSAAGKSGSAGNKTVYHKDGTVSFTGKYDGPEG